MGKVLAWVLVFGEGRCMYLDYVFEGLCLWADFWLYDSLSDRGNSRYSLHCASFDRSKLSTWCLLKSKAVHCFGASPLPAVWGLCSSAWNTPYPVGINGQWLTVRRLRPRRIRWPSRQSQLPRNVQPTQHRDTEPDRVNIHSRMHFRIRNSYLLGRPVGSTTLDHAGLCVSHGRWTPAGDVVYASAHDHWESCLGDGHW